MLRGKSVVSHLNFGTSIEGMDGDIESGRLDSNQRPPAPHAGALPSCATPRVASGYHTVSGPFNRCQRWWQRNPILTGFSFGPPPTAWVPAFAGTTRGGGAGTTRGRRGNDDQVLIYSCPLPDCASEYRAEWDRGIRWFLGRSTDVSAGGPLDGGCERGTGWRILRAGRNAPVPTLAYGSEALSYSLPR